MNMDNQNQVNNETPNLLVNEDVSSKTIKNKLIIMFSLIGILFIAPIVLAIVLIVITINEKNQSTEYKGEPQTLYYYEISSDIYDYFTYDIFTFKKESDEVNNYKLITSYDCKTTCPAIVDYTNDGFYFYDDGVMYNYDKDTNKFNELNIDYEYKLKDYIFKVSGDYIVTIGLNNSDIGFKNIYYDETLSESEEVDEYIYILGDTDTLKNGVVGIIDTNKLTVYSGDKALGTIDANSMIAFGLEMIDEFFLLDLTDEYYVFTKNAMLPIRLRDDDYDGRYDMNDGILTFLEDNKIIMYDSEGNESVYDADKTSIVYSNYVVLIKNKKLEIYDTRDKMVVHSFEINENLDFVDDEYSGVDIYDLDGDIIVEVFLKDKSLPEDPEGLEIKGKSYYYNVHTGEEEIEDDTFLLY